MTFEKGLMMNNEELAVAALKQFFNMDPDAPYTNKFDVIKDGLFFIQHRQQRDITKVHCMDILMRIYETPDVQKPKCKACGDSGYIMDGPYMNDCTACNYLTFQTSHGIPRDLNLTFINKRI